MSADAVISAAKADLGYRESPPNSNRTKYWEAFDPAWQGQPWCVSALWCWFNWAGEGPAFMGGGKTASCSILLRWFSEMGQVVPVNDVKVGDIVLLCFNGKGTPDHCGLVTEVNRWSGTRELILVQTVEGNTTNGSGSQDDGGMVCAKTRYPSQIVAVCRPNYRSDAPAVVPDYAGRWSEEYWVKGRALGIIKDAEDGKYRPKDNATREEVLAMIIRAMEAKS